MNLWKKRRKKIEERPSRTDDEERIEVVSVFEATVQCDVCDYWGKMKGGRKKDDMGVAVFVCPVCDSKKYMKWRI